MSTWFVFVPVSSKISLLEVIDFRFAVKRDKQIDFESEKESLQLHLLISSSLFPGLSLSKLHFLSLSLSFSLSCFNWLSKSIWNSNHTYALSSQVVSFIATSTLQVIHGTSSSLRRVTSSSQSSTCIRIYSSPVFFLSLLLHPLLSLSLCVYVLLFSLSRLLCYKYRECERVQIESKSLEAHGRTKKEQNHNSHWHWLRWWSMRWTRGKLHLAVAHLKDALNLARDKDRK